MPLKKRLTVLHTSMVFINVEPLIQDLLAEVMAGIDLFNIVDDSLLPEVMKVGGVTASVRRRIAAYIRAAEEAGAHAVLSVCSSVGPAVDAARAAASIPVIKIDEAMAGRAVEMSDRIGILATVPTTLGPTAELIRKKAETAAREIHLESMVAGGAFEALMAGDRGKHNEHVLSAARDMAHKVELILFAQASMTRLGPAVEEATGLTVLTSPRLGIEQARRILDGLP